MTGFNLLLGALLVVCALGLVTAQHQARKLFVELQQQQTQERKLDEEWGQLQLEQSTWAMHSRIEKIATTRLGMKVAPSSRAQVIPPAGR